MCRIATISLHSCPLADLGERQAGGMNVYVREISRELGRRGMEIDIFTRLTDPGLPRIVEYADNARVIHLPAGAPAHIDKNEIANYLPEFICGALRFAAENDIQYKFLHSHYWLSGWAGVHLARRWRVPHVTMFPHTCAGEESGEALSGGKRTAGGSRRKSDEELRRHRRVQRARAPFDVGALWCNT